MRDTAEGQKPCLAHGPANSYVFYTEIEDSLVLLEKLKNLPGEDELGNDVTLEDFFRTCGNIGEDDEPPHEALSRHAKISNEFFVRHHLSRTFLH